MGLPTNLPSVARAKLPEVYERAKGALSDCSRIDECKDWADKAEALASYAKQAGDNTLRKMADRIQARAIRRCGELLAAIERSSQGGRPPKNKSGGGPVSRRQAARDAGLSPRQQRTSLRVARVPEYDFEAAVESDTPPTVTKLAEAGKLPAAFNLHGRKPDAFATATTVLGWLRESVDVSKHKPSTVAAGMLPKEIKRKRETLKTIRALVRWLQRLEKAISKQEE